jgi:hypothetical protein
MGGRFGKYGDVKRKAQIRKARLRPPALQQRRKNKPPGRGINDTPVCMNWDTVIRSFQVLSRELIIPLVRKRASQEQSPGSCSSKKLVTGNSKPIAGQIICLTTCQANYVI